MLLDKGVELGEEAAHGQIGPTEPDLKDIAQNQQGRNEGQEGQGEGGVHHKQHHEHPNDEQEILEQHRENGNIKLVQGGHVVGGPGDQTSHGLAGELVHRHVQKVPDDVLPDAGHDVLTDGLKPVGLDHRKNQNQQQSTEI